jgi:chromosome segregation ATPase
MGSIGGSGSSNFSSSYQLDPSSLRTSVPELQAEIARLSAELKDKAQDLKDAKEAAATHRKNEPKYTGDSDDDDAKAAFAKEHDAWETEQTTLEKTVADATTAYDDCKAELDTASGKMGAAQAADDQRVNRAMQNEKDRNAQSASSGPKDRVEGEDPNALEAKKRLRTLPPGASGIGPVSGPGST